MACLLDNQGCNNLALFGAFLSEECRIGNLSKQKKIEVVSSTLS